MNDFLVLIIVTTVGTAAIGGWIANIVKFFGMLDGVVTATFILRAIGIFFPPPGHGPGLLLAQRFRVIRRSAIALSLPLVAHLPSGSWRPFSSSPTGHGHPIEKANMSEAISNESAAGTTISAASLPPIGSPFGGGFYGGQINVNGIVFAVIWAPKNLGQTRAVWFPSYTAIPGTESRSDSVANTTAMAAAGSPAGIWALTLDINGFNDWVIPARDALELGYRHFKPTQDENYADGYDGVNPSSMPVGEAYTDEFPAQTQLSLFADDGEEAFDETWYWSSTQSTQYSDYGAWGQNFDHGSQYGGSKKFEAAVRAVRLIQVTG
jgi:hypothetical protein